MSYQHQPINNHQQQQYMPIHPGMVVPQQTQAYGTAPVVYAQPYTQSPYQPTTDASNQALLAGYAADQERRKRGSRRCMILCLTLCIASVLTIALAIYFGAIRCRGGDVVAGQCPAREYSYYLPQPKTFTHGSQCHADDATPGDCCSWRDASCLTSYGCTHKHEYSWSSSSNSTCRELMGLLSCAVASPKSGIYTGPSDRIYVCNNFCNEIWQACKAPSSNPTDYCNSLYGLEVRADQCYSAAGHTSSNMIMMALAMIAAYIAAKHA